MIKPLQGIRIVAVEQYGAGPFGTMFLAELGADVIKIENPAGGGDVSRQTGPHFLPDGDSLFFQSLNKCKRSLTLDLKHPDGRKIFDKLIPRTDALVNNLRGNQPDAIGLTYASLKDVNPKIVCAHLSAYGRTGTRQSWPGYDYLMQAEAGYMSLTGEPDGGPTRMGLSMIDFMAGMTTALAVASALVGAMRQGKGCDVDVPLFDVAVAQLNYPAAWYLNSGATTHRRPRSGHPATVPCELFPTGDGWIFVMAMTDKFWSELCRVVGQPGLIADPRFFDADARRRNREVLAGILDQAFATRSTAEWLELLNGKVPAAPIFDLAQALENPFLREAGLIERHSHPAKDDLRLLANPIRIDGQRLASRPAPTLGADTDTVLGELGYSSDEIAALRQAKVV